MAGVMTTTMSKRLQFTNPEVLQQFLDAANKKANYSMGKLFFLSLLGGFFLGMGSLMSAQVGGRWGGTTGQNNFVFGGFGIPFGLMMIVFTGAELVTGNFLVFTLHILHERSAISVFNAMKSFIVSWYGNFAGTLLVAAAIAWQSEAGPPPFNTPTHIFFFSFPLRLTQTFLCRSRQRIVPPIVHPPTAVTSPFFTSPKTRPPTAEAAQLSRTESC